MQPEPHEIAHVSDTALMTAACRAMETVDPAESLSGARGMAIANNLPGLERMRFGVCLRSRFLDELLLDTGKSTSIQRSDAGSSSRQS
jgi:O-methyltransferase involved in polyketide biosynthesis